MVLPKRISSFLSKFKDTFFIYKDGFFVLNYNAMSPQKTVDSFGGMRFNTHDVEKQALITKNPFFSGTMRYQKIEEGLWLYISNLKYNNFLNFNAQYDLNDPEPYYLFNFNAGIAGITKTSIINHEHSEPKTWVLAKPNVRTNNLHFKGGRVHYITLFFTEKWLQENIANTPNYPNSKLHLFLTNPNQKCIMWVDPRKYAHDVHEGITNIFNTDLSQPVPKDLTQLRVEIMKFINGFIFLYTNNEIHLNTYDVSNVDRKKLFMAEKKLLKTLKLNFPGIDTLATEIGMSPTKFKQQFKLIYGQSPYQYYQYQQMQLAMELLQSNLKISEVATMLGYENASKFSAAFKKHHGVLPSQL